MISKLVHTYSIIAIDEVEGIMGGAVQSHYFSVGGTVIWAEAGKGVVATQAMVNMDYGYNGLKLLAEGACAADVLSKLTSSDKAADIRQAAVLDCRGLAAAHTGASTIAEASHITGRGFSTQANMMLNTGVPEAMAQAYKKSAGRLQDRLFSALIAAEAAGGDIRGMQSAAMLIVSIEEKQSVRDNIILDLRVEDSPSPLAELERLLNIHDAYAYFELGDLAIEKADDISAMQYFRKAEILLPENIELQFWKAVSLLNNKLYDEALLIFKRVVEADANWKVLLGRLPASGIVNNDTETLDFIENKLK